MESRDLLMDCIMADPMPIMALNGINSADIRRTQANLGRSSCIPSS